MELFDSHCHIQSSTKQGGEPGEAATRQRWAKAGYPDGDTIIARAVEHDVTRMVVVGCSLQDSRLAVEFAMGRDNVYAAIGVHPHEAKDHLDEATWLEFAALAANPNVVAIGECGLDYFYEHSDPASQAIVLHKQLAVAQQHGLPLIFHVREALDDFWPIFDSYPDLKGVLHSFTDSKANLMKALERELLIGVNGIATFAKNPGQLDMYKKIPTEKLLLETDSPFLTPAPDRGTICEPYHISVIASFLAELRQTELTSLAAATTANARQLFNV